MVARVPGLGGYPLFTNKHDRANYPGDGVNRIIADLTGVGTTIGGGLTLRDSGAGTPTILKLGDGRLRVLHDTGGSGVAIAGIDTNDTLGFAMDNGVHCGGQFHIPSGASGLEDSGDEMVFGFASAFNSTLDSVATNLWVRFIYDSVSGTIKAYFESDDGTTDDDDNDTGFAVTAGVGFNVHVICEQVPVGGTRYASCVITDASGLSYEVRTSMNGLAAATMVQPCWWVARGNNAEATSAFVQHELWWTEKKAV